MHLRAVSFRRRVDAGGHELPGKADGGSVGRWPGSRPHVVAAANGTPKSTATCPVAARPRCGSKVLDREDLAPAGLMHATGDHQRLVDHPAALADVLDLGV
jgi:hypothetical protein